MFWLIMGLALGLRLTLALTYDGFLGVDGGAYLLSRNYVLGDEPTGAGFPRPPLAPGFLLVPFTFLFGDNVGYKIWSSVAATLPLIPVYLITRKFATPSIASLAALFASVDLLWAEMFVTGALPLIGFTLLGLAWYSILQLTEGHSWKYQALLVFSVGLIPWVNQTTAGLALITLPFFFLATFYFVRRQYGRMDGGPRMVNLVWYVLPAAFIGGLIAFAAFPWYTQTLPGSSILSYQGPLLYLTHPFDSAWIQALFIALPLGIFVVWKAERYELKAVGATILLLGFMVPWLSYDEVIINPPYRARYLMALAFYPLIFWVVWKYWLPWVEQRAFGSAYAALGIIVALSIVTWGFFSQFERQASYSVMVTPATERALEYVDGNTATNSFTLSLWIAALQKVQAPFLTTAPPPPAFIRSDEQLRCLFGWATCDIAEARSRLDLEYLLVDTRFPYYNDRVPGNYLAPPDQWGVTAAAPWLEVVYQEGTTVLWRITQ